MDMLITILKFNRDIAIRKLKTTFTLVTVAIIDFKQKNNKIGCVNVCVKFNI